LIAQGAKIVNPPFSLELRTCKTDPFTHHFCYQMILTNTTDQ